MINIFFWRKKRQASLLPDQAMALRAYLEKDISKRSLNDIEWDVAIRRKWKATYPDRVVPMIGMESIIPPGLTKEEEDNYLRGSLGEAMTLYLMSLNTSFTKQQLCRKLVDLGIEYALNVFTDKEQEGLKTVIKYLPEEVKDGNSQEEGVIGVHFSAAGS